MVVRTAGFCILAILAIVFPYETRAVFFVTPVIFSSEQPSIPPFVVSLGAPAAISSSISEFFSKFKVAKETGPPEQKLTIPDTLPATPKIEETVNEKENVVVSEEQPAINKKFALMAAVENGIQGLESTIRRLGIRETTDTPSPEAQTNERKEESGKKSTSEWSLIQTINRQISGEEKTGGVSEWLLIQIEKINTARPPEEQKREEETKKETDESSLIQELAKQPAGTAQQKAKKDSSSLNKISSETESSLTIVQGSSQTASVSSIDIKLNALENSLRAEIYRVAQNSSIGPGLLQAISLSQRINQLSSVTISGSTITGSSVAGSFSGGVSASSLSVSSTATSTFSNGIDLTTGCFSVNGACLSLVGGSGTPGGNSGNVQFNNGGNFGGNDGLFYLASAGRLGIGTTTPYGVLHIASSTRPQMLLTDTSAGTNLKHWYASSTQGSLAFGTLSDNLTALTEEMRLTGTGLGIGTTSPFTTLAVAGSGYFDSNITSSNITATGTLVVSGLATFSGGASTTLMSVYNTLYVGGAATSTIQGATTGTSTLQGFLSVLGTNSTSTFSGNLAVAGTTSIAAFFQSGFADCQGPSNTIVYTLSSGKFGCDPDGGGAGGSEINFTYAANSGDVTYGRVYMSTTTNQLVVGATATTSLAKLEVIGNQYVSGNLGLGTTSPSTVLSVQGNGLISGNLSLANLTATGTITSANISISSLTGPLQASSGTISATTSVGVVYGGTGLTAAPAFGQILRGTGTGYALVATSTLGIAISDTAGTLAATRGGTGLSAVTNNQLLLGAAGNTWTQIATSSLGLLISDTLGTLAVNRGGTNSTAQTSSGVNFFNGTSITSGTGLTFDGTRLGIGSTSPSSLLAVHANNGGTNKILFTIASSTASATTTLFSVDNTGLTTIGDSTGTGDALFQFASDIDAWSIGYFSADKTFRIASSTNLSANVLFQIGKSGTTSLSSGLGAGTGGNYLCIDITTFEILRGNGVACTASSLRFKENVRELSYGIDEVMRLHPVMFTYKPEMNSGTSTHLGFIAEEVELIIPELVSYNNAGQIQGLDYPVVASLLTKALQELNLNLEAIAGIAASSTPKSDSFAARFFSRMREWLSSATNNIGDFFANRVRTKELCVGDQSGETCITKAQLDALLSGQAASVSGSQSTSGTAPSTETPSTAADIEPPVITLSGNNPATLNIGETYGDLGAMVTDNVDQNLGYKVSLDGGPLIYAHELSLDTSVAGTHEILFSATDNAGNTGTATRTVNMVNPNIMSTTTIEATASTTDTTVTSTTP